MTPRPPPTPFEPTVYVVATDDTPAASHVLDVACDLGAALGGAAELHVVHVLDSPPIGGAIAAAGILAPPNQHELAMLVLDRTTAYAAERFKGRIVGHLAAGNPWREIVQLASKLDADLVIVGTAGHTGMTRLALGSCAEQVVRHASCPVLVARPKDEQPRPDAGVEPPCTDCVATRKDSQRAKMWCTRHSEHHPRGNTHYELPPTFAMGSMNFRP